MRSIAEWTGLLGGPTLTAFAIKLTLVLCGSSVLLRAARRTNAATRHAIVVCTFGVLIALPAIMWLTPGFSIQVPAPTTPAPTPPAPPSPRFGSVTGNGSVWRDPVQTIPLREVLIALWAAGVVLALVPTILDLRRLSHLRRTALPFSGHRSLAVEAVTRAAIRRHVEFRVHEHIAAPCVCGVLRPTVLLPESVTAWNHDDVRRAIDHEIEHVRRSDLGVQLATRIVCAAYWFHPMVWRAWQRLTTEAERACDDAVLQRADRTDYAGQLVSLARLLSSQSPQPTLAMANRRDLTTRISAILDPSQKRGRLRTATTTAAVVVASLVALAMSPIRSAQVVYPAHVVYSPTVTQLIIVALECPRNRSQTSLLRAAERGDVARIDALVDAGADLNCSISGDGTPLIVAARAGKISAVERLLDLGARPNLAALGDGNPLIVAAAEGHLEIVQLLVARGANIDDVVPGDENPLIQASANGHVDVARFLIANGADVNVRVTLPSTEWKGSEVRSPLIMAQRSGGREVIALLQAAGAK